jgi:predicted nucleic acid-binding protein
MEKKEKRILIDTDVLINYFDENKKSYLRVKEVFNSFEIENTITYVSLVSVIEIIQGNKSNVEKNKILKKLIPFSEIDITISIGNIAKDLILKYSSTHGLLLADSLIAATAIQLEIPLFSLNTKDYKFIDTLKLYEPK